MSQKHVKKRRTLKNNKKYTVHLLTNAFILTLNETLLVLSVVILLTNKKKVIHKLFFSSFLIGVSPQKDS